MKSLQLYQGIDEGSAALLTLLPRSLVAIALRHWLHPTNYECDETTVDFSASIFSNWTDRQHWPDHVYHLEIRMNEGLRDEVSRSSWWCFWSSRVFEDSRVLLDLLEHPLAMIIEWETFINVIAKVFVHGCSLDGMLTNRERERELEWLLVDVSIATRSWGSWSAVSTRRRRLGLDSMLAGLFVPFELRIQFEATMERHGWSVQDHRRTDDNGWLKESVELFHSEREEIGSIRHMCFWVLM